MNRRYSDSLFPQTPPIRWSECHSVVVDKMLMHPDGILQKNLVRKTGINKSTVSMVLTDLKKLGTVIEVDLGSGKEIMLKSTRITELKSFLGQWQFIKQSAMLRPHSNKFL